MWFNPTQVTSSEGLPDQDASGSGVFRHCDLTEFRRGGSCDGGISDGVGRNMVLYLILRTEMFIKGEIIGHMVVYVLR